MLSKNDLRDRCGLGVAISFVLMVGVVLIAVVEVGGVTTKPITVAEIALYRGPDREKILIEGAKKEGQVVFYNSQTWFNTGVVEAFEKKYPFIKVLSWRSTEREILTRVTEEWAARRYLVDVIETSDPAILVLREEKMFQEYYSPEMSYYEDSAKEKGKIGVYYLADRENYIGLGFNTKVVPPSDAPKTYKDLLDPRWKGKISIAGSNTGVRWIGNCLEAMGRDFIEKLSSQDVKVHNLSGAALAALVVSGEVPLCPTIYDSSMFSEKEKGAPVEWRPLEPVVAAPGLSGITIRAPHPHAALLFLDYIHSKEGQQVVIKGGLSSPREDIGSLEKKFKKTYLASKYSLEMYERKSNEWETLMRQLFIRKK